MCSIANLKEDSQFVIVTTAAVSDSSHVDFLRLETIKEGDHFLARFRSVQICYAIMGLLMAWATVEHVDFELEWGLLLLNDLREEFRVILVVLAIVRLRVNLVFVEALANGLTIAITASTVILIASISPLAAAVATLIIIVVIVSSAVLIVSFATVAITSAAISTSIVIASLAPFSAIASITAAIAIFLIVAIASIIWTASSIVVATVASIIVLVVATSFVIIVSIVSVILGARSVSLGLCLSISATISSF